MRKLFGNYQLLPILILTSISQIWAQAPSPEPRYELGGGVVGSFYDKKTLTSTAGNADAGFDMGLGASAWIGHNMYPKISGEIRYDYLRNDMTLESGSTKASFGGESHAIHYDVHFHFAEVGAKFRPYIITGAGVKIYRGTGQERAFQPLSQIAVLTHTQELTGLLSVGAGIKFQVGEKVQLRFEFRDNISRFPKKVIAPNRASGGDGWINNFAPTAGVSVLF